MSAPTSRHLAWRLAFLLAAALILAGGPRHPSGTMPEMLANPSWVPAHAMVLAGTLALLGGLLLVRTESLPDRTRRWSRLAVWATVGQVVEMTLHTAAVVDRTHLASGAATPVLSTHLALAVITYPVFGLGMSGFILAGARDRVLGSPWIAWLGIVGLVAQGVAPGAMLLGAGEPVRRLFWGLALFGLWLALAALWPRASHRNATTSR